MNKEDEITFMLNVIKDGHCNSRTMRDSLGLASTPQFGAVLTRLIDTKFVTKTASKSGNLNEFVMTRPGQDHLRRKAQKDLVPSKQEFVAHVDELIAKTASYGSRGKNKAPVPHIPTSGKALSAIEGIADLVNTNNDLMGFMRSLQRKINAKVAELDGEEVEESEEVS